MNIAIAIPCRNIWNSDFGCSMMAIVQYTCLYRKKYDIAKDGKINIAIVKREGATVTQNKHRLIEECLKIGADKILMVDADMVYPQNILIELLLANKLIIGCNCTNRTPPIRPLAIGFDDKPIKDGKGIDKVKKLPGGILLMDKAIFATIEKPYFDAIYRSETNDWLQLDYYFSEKARASGFDLWCHHDISKNILHIGEVPCGL